MNAMTTTLKDIRAASPCTEGWETLIKNIGKSSSDAKSDTTPLPVLTVLESNGVDDALWVLDNVVGNRHICRLFAADCAEMVLPLFEKERPNDTRPRDAIAVARYPAAWAAAGAAARDAAWAAAWAAIKHRLVQYLTHGEAAKDMDWPEKLIFDAEDVV